MSKGNPIAKVRVPPGLMAEIDAACERLRHTSRATPPDRSEFLRRAVREKLDHMERSRRKRAKKGEADGRGE